MDRIIGKIQQVLMYGFLFFVSATLLASAPDISMRMINREDSSPLTQAGIGHPFVIEVMVTDIARVGQYPAIKGLENFSAKNVGINIKTVNGRTTACYSYEVRIDTAGTYDIGPAELADGRQTLRSSVLHVIVGDQAVGQSRTTHRKNNEKSLVFMRLTTDKNKAVVGERVSCSLRFYTSQGNAIKQLIEQEVSHLTRKQMHGPFEGAERIDGADYQYAEWRWYVYPKNPGKQVIPAYGADYEIQTERDNYWGGLGRFFGSRIETKRVYSNAVALEVTALPEHDTPINAVGSFSSMNITANPTVAKQGEGITVTIELIGDGDPETIQCPVLRGLPDALKWYESKKSFSNSDESNKKQVITFEFVVQGLKQGSWQIPSQSFHYYDSGRREYRTLKSAPVTITIMPGAPQKNSLVNRDAKNLEHTDQLLLAPLHPVICGAACNGYIIPWWLVFLLAIMPVMGCIGFVIIRFIANYHAKKSMKTLSDRAFSHAHALLRVAHDQNRGQDIYGIVIGCIAARCKISPAHVSIEFIEARLHTKHISDSDRAQLRLFFEKITHCAYSNELTVDNQLFTQAEQWLKRLDEYFPAK